MSFTSNILEGGLLPNEILEQIAEGELQGQTISDFDSTSSQTIPDFAADLWQVARYHWTIFQRRLQALPSGESATTITRRYWLKPLLDVLGYNLEYQAAGYTVDGRSYAISHRADLHPNAPPVHIIGAHEQIDKRSASARRTPHALLQEFLNSTEHLWGIVSNGLQLRLLRDSSRFARPSYLEFDLESIFAHEKFNEFVFLVRLLHRSRLPQSFEDAATCWLEFYYQQAIESGGRVRDKLRAGVEQALRSLGNGFLQHPQNGDLRDKLENYEYDRNPDKPRLSPQVFYRQLLWLVYRVLFLMVVEERGLITAYAVEQAAADDQDSRNASRRLRIYQRYYSLNTLRHLSTLPGMRHNKFNNLWQGLKVTFQILEGSDSDTASPIGVPPLNSELFNRDTIADLLDQQLANHYLLDAIGALSLYQDQQQNRRVNYAALDVEELGSIYESLLDFRPSITLFETCREFALLSGTERKTTGSYYTRPELVQELIKSALEPVIDQRLNPGRKLSALQAEQALLQIKVCDPTCGSGHFLLAAARRLGRELARIRTGELHPTPDQFRNAVRDVIQHCIFGVDLNPLAIDLCKLSLWIEGHCVGKPLNFLDHHIRQGNGLVGTTKALLAAGIPDNAFKPHTGDDKTLVAGVKKRNKLERLVQQAGNVQLTLFDAMQQLSHQPLQHALDLIYRKPSNTIPQIHEKAETYKTARSDSADMFLLYDLWTAAFFQTFQHANEAIITSKILFDYQDKPSSLPEAIRCKVKALAKQVGFFHWELEFPQVFGGEQPGFDVVLGNPPWERIKLQEQEHFVDVPEISKAGNKAVRDRVIAAWRAGDAKQKARIAEFDRAKQQAEAESLFVRESQRFRLTAVGDVNTYALFSEHARDLLNAQGRAGIIVPTGIATDDSTKAFFGDLNACNQLVSLYDFENSLPIFAGVHRSFKFCLVTIGKAGGASEFSFFITKTQDLHKEQRTFTLSAEDIALINPNTRTAPIFRTKADAELCKAIYSRVPVLLREERDARAEENPWGISFMRMFDMSNDSALFQNVPGNTTVPLYEAKLLHQYTHRWASYQQENPRDVSLDELRDPQTVITPRYWVEQEEVDKRLATRNWAKPWLLGFRDITNTTNERTAIFSLLPRVAVGHKAPLVFLSNANITEVILFLGTVNSLVFDFIARQKVGGTNLTYFIVKQLPVLPPERFGEAELAFIVPRVLELVYSAYDLQPFAQDVWAEADIALRSLIIQQRQANHALTQQYVDAEMALQVDDLSLFQDLAPPPFIWHEERRAVLRAELDALIAKLYGLSRDELRYILDPQDVYGPDFPGETFRVLKERELRQYGEYRTQRLVLAAWDRLEQGLFGRAVNV